MLKRLYDTLICYNLHARNAMCYGPFSAEEVISIKAFETELVIEYARIAQQNNTHMLITFILYM